tara:strand:+ start:5065 stop:5430 length:366 start_codon:yes stop_codon:yes gene_type:complete
MQKHHYLKNTLVNVRKINGKKNNMNIAEIAENYSKDKRKMMSNCVIQNSNYTKNFTQYHTSSLEIMFAEWHLLFPQHKQDINCTSCRAAVVKFWETMMDEWIVSEQVVIKKPNAKKKKKAK